jgi:adenylate cyclase
MTEVLTKILVVDDEPDLEQLIRQKFRKQIRENKYVFEFASNGVNALNVLGNDIDLVLSDINMPEMDGLTLLPKINEFNSAIKTIIVSAYGDMDNIRVAMNRGAFDFILKPINFDDLELTIEKTITYIQQAKQNAKMERENDILKMYVDQSVVNIMSTNGKKNAFENEIVDATVAFIDICGFTSLSENKAPDDVVNLLNKYFDVIVHEIIKEGGMVDKFMGDCVMAIFKGEYHIDRAVETCLRIIENMSKLPVHLSFEPHVSIGINSGEMLFGNIGSATMKRLDFTVIGDVVNTAQRLQSLANADEIYISEDTFKLIKDSFTCELIGERQLKNKAEKVIVYKVIH